MDTNIQPFDGNSFVWVFCGEHSHFPCACFTTLMNAGSWISKTRVTGTLTRYPLDLSIYDWATDKEFFKPKFPSHFLPEFVQKFSSAYLEHYHFVNGICSELENNHPCQEELSTVSNGENKND